MEKTIKLGDKEVHLVSSAATPLIYKAQFKSDFFKDMLKLASGLEGIETDKNGDVDIKALDMDAIDKFDLSVLYNFIWALAKNKDNSIGEPTQFFSNYESLDLDNSMPAIQDLVMASIQTTKK